MKNYTLIYTPQAQKDAKKLKKSNLKDNALKILTSLENNPFTPPYEPLIGRLKGSYSKRINIQHRIVYKVNKTNKTVTILRMWTHYE